MTSKAITTKRERVSHPSVIQFNAPLDVSQGIADERTEMAVIGAVLQKQDVFPSVSEIVQAGDFFFLQNGYIWHAFELLFSERQGIDILTVSEKLESIKYTRTGDELSRYLVDCIQAAPDVNHVEQYARKVFEASLRIRVLKSAAEIQKITLDRSLNVDELIDRCDWLLYGATNRQVESKTSAKDIVSAYYDKVERNMQSDSVPGVMSGFTALDEMLHGFYPGEVTVIGGGEGMGKTTTMLSMLRNMAASGKRVALFTLEMMQEEIIRILSAMETGIYKDVLKTFQLSSYQWGLFVEAAGKIASWKLHIVDEFTHLTPIQLRRKLRKLMVDEEIELVAIDGLWLMEADEPTKERFRDVFTIMRDLNVLAREFGVPVVITHQYSKEYMGATEPTVYHFAESAGVRRNAQVMCGLHQFKDDAGARQTELYILKDRNGTSQGEKLALTYNRDFSRYEGGRYVPGTK